VLLRQFIPWVTRTVRQIFQSHQYRWDGGFILKCCNHAKVGGKSAMANARLVGKGGRQNNSFRLSINDRFHPVPSQFIADQNSIHPTVFDKNDLSFQTSRRNFTEFCTFSDDHQFSRYGHRIGSDVIQVPVRVQPHGRFDIVTSSSKSIDWNLHLTV